MPNNVIYFYRATGDFGFLSMLFPAPVEFEGRVLPTGEHAYQYGKFVDKAVAEWAMTAPKPHLIAVLAHNIFAWDIVPGWAAMKVDRMKAVVTAKFQQHGDLLHKLLDTHEALLVENSKMDSFWGLGKKGNGKNMLGRILMDVRKELRLKGEE